LPAESQIVSAQILSLWKGGIKYLVQLYSFMVKI
jgi:hypothetical protein